MFTSHQTDRFLTRVLAGLAITVAVAVSALSHAVAHAHAFL